jgi:uncharacterized membrane protein YuzA (DUF378 family)
MMATINAPASERRHLSDRRTTGGSLLKAKMNVLDWTAMVLMIIGGINWGLVGLINFDVVAALFGTQSPLARLVYVLVGLAALYSIYTSAKIASAPPRTSP